MPKLQEHMNENEVIALIRPKIKGCTITEVEDFGDAFAIFFVNDEYYKSGKIEDMAIGAGPFIYIKETGEIFETGSAQSAEHYIKAYRECGDIYGRRSEILQITGFEKSLNKKRAVLNLKSVLGSGLAESKNFIEKVISDSKTEVTLGTEREAEDAKAKLVKFGFKVKHLWR